jgi:hypothetical protein
MRLHITVIRVFSELFIHLYGTLLLSHQSLQQSAMSMVKSNGILPSQPSYTAKGTVRSTGLPKEAQ